MLTGKDGVNAAQTRAIAAAGAASVARLVQEAPVYAAPSRLCETSPQVIRHASLPDISTLIRAPARAMISQRFGWAEPKSAKTVVKITGNGFQLEPPAMCRSPCRISRPQISHDHGS